MRFVETVARELIDLIERSCRPDFPHFDVVFGRTRDKRGALRCHFGRLSFTHGAAQQIGAAQAVARENLRGLHYLFLIYHDAERLFAASASSLGWRYSGVLLAVLALDVFRNVVHRAGTIKCDERDDVLEAVAAQPAAECRACPSFPSGTRPSCRLARALRRSLASSSGSLSRSSIYPSSCATDRRAFLQHVEGFQAEKVELHQSRGLRRLSLNCVAGKSDLDRGTSAPVLPAPCRRSRRLPRGWRRCGKALPA